FFQAEDGIRDLIVTGVQTCALPIYRPDRCSSRSESSGVGLLQDVSPELSEREEHRSGRSVHHRDGRVREEPADHVDGNDLANHEIGRASCRERREMPEETEAMKEAE